MKYRHGESPKDRPGDLYPRARHQGAQRGRQPRVEGAGCGGLREAGAGGCVLSEGGGDGGAGLASE